MAIALSDVRFQGDSRHHLNTAGCRLMTRERHRRVKIAVLQLDP
jgi:hypothetical protein